MSYVQSIVLTFSCIIHAEDVWAGVKGIVRSFRNRARGGGAKWAERGDEWPSPKLVHDEESLVSRPTPCHAHPQSLLTSQTMGLWCGAQAASAGFQALLGWEGREGETGRVEDPDQGSDEGELILDAPVRSILAFLFNALASSWIAS